MANLSLSVVVLDYDGTIADNGVLHPEVRAAIAEIRASGLTVVLATGRILSDLQGVLGDLRVVDAVVAENGAVLAFPESGRSTALGAAPDSFVAALRQRNVQVTVGECVVETDASAAPIVLDLVRQMELPLVLAFNAGRLMVLPQGMSKATGLNAALRALRLSEHNAIAIGNAENDHAMLTACEVGVAVSWGSPALREVADEVIDGDGPAAVADYLRRLRPPAGMPIGGPDRHRVLLGALPSGDALSLAVRGRNVLVAGDPRSGKSWLTGLLCEQLILQHYCVCVVDPEGDYRPLEALPRVVAFGGSSSPPRPYEVARTLRHPDVSMVIDLSHLKHEEKRDYVQTLLPLLAALRNRGGIPHRIVLDEAHYFVEGPDGRLLLDLDAGGYTLATYRPAQLAPSVLAAAGVVLLTRTTDLSGLRALHAEEVADGVGRLSLGEAMLLPSCDESPNQPMAFRIAPRLTEHVRHRQKYLDIPVADRHAFVFTSHNRPLGCKVQTLTEFGAFLSECPPPVLAGHLDRGDVSRWVGDVFGDYVLAGRIYALEQLHRMGRPLDAADALRQLVDERYTLVPRM
jgi:hydroxymethylpyrimidine pyrophosphatase-like HAD family hydrolase